MMRKIRTISTAGAALLVLPALLAFTGCSSTSVNESTYEVSQDAEGNYQVSENFFVNNPKLARGLQITEQSSRFVGDLLTVQVSLASKYDDTQNYKYKFSWCDAEGVEIDPGASPWLPLTMYGFQTKKIQGVAPNPAARSFKLMMRTD